MPCPVMYRYKQRVYQILRYAYVKKAASSHFKCKINTPCWVILLILFTEILVIIFDTKYQLESPFTSVDKSSKEQFVTEKKLMRI